MPTTSSPIQVRQIDHVTIVVNSLDAAKAFYVGLLGMEDVARPAFDFPGAWYQAGSTMIHVIGRHDVSGPAGWDHVAPAATRGHHIAFVVDDPVAAADALKRAGVEIVSGPKHRPDGCVQTFIRDPDGHLIELCNVVP